MSEVCSFCTVQLFIIWAVSLLRKINPIYLSSIGSKLLARSYYDEYRRCFEVEWSNAVVDVFNFVVAFQMYNGLGLFLVHS